MCVCECVVFINRTQLDETRQKCYGLLIKWLTGDQLLIGPSINTLDLQLKRYHNRKVPTCRTGFCSNYERIKWILQRIFNYIKSASKLAAPNDGTEATAIWQRQRQLMRNVFIIYFDIYINNQSQTRSHTQTRRQTPRQTRRQSRRRSLSWGRGDTSGLGASMPGVCPHTYFMACHCLYVLFRAYALTYVLCIGVSA